MRARLNSHIQISKQKCKQQEKNRLKEETMPTESDPITQMIRNRALQAAEKLVPMCNKASEQLQGCFYVAAMDRLAELKGQIDHTSTLISILRDWQAANAPEVRES